MFQLDGGPLRSLMRLMHPDNFEDISALIALYRPGPMGADSHTNYALRKIGRQEVTPIHPELAEPLAEILSTSYGLIIYQEQVMAIAQKVAGFSLGQADILRRAMGKKKKSELDKQYAGFAAGMKANGYSDGCVKTLWDILLPFSDYAFNKAHSAAYGVISYWTAYLKANYPAEYMAALLTSVKDDKDKMAIYLAECRRMGIKVLPPCVNSSDANFTPVGKDIRFGLTAIRNVGSNVVTSIVATRQQKGEFADFADFLRKVEAVVCNKRTIEALIKGGAFDSMHHPRRGLINVYEPAVDAVLDTKRAEAIGQFDLFGDLGAGGDGAVDVFAVRIPEGEWDKKVLLQFEREMLGLYVSDHPLFGLEHILAGAADETIPAALESGEEPRNVTLAGILSSVNRRVTKAGAPWANVVLEDLEGSIEVMFFPQTYANVALTIAEDAVVAIKGRTDARDDTVKLIASDLTVLDTTAEGVRGPIVLSMDADLLHAAGDRPAQGDPVGAPRHDRGAPQARRPEQPRGAPGQRRPRHPGTDERTQAAGRRRPRLRLTGPDSSLARVWGAPGTVGAMTSGLPEPVRPDPFRKPEPGRRTGVRRGRRVPAGLAVEPVGARALPRRACRDRVDRR